MEHPVRILCVDDERNVLRALERLFLDEDYELVSALSAEEGLSRLEEVEGIQVILSDYRMPGINGVDFLKEVTRRWPDTVRIVLSGYADTAAVVSAINDGQIYKFIPKPWNDDELQITIQNALEKYSLVKRNAELLEELHAANENLSRIVDNLEATVAERTVKLTLQNQALVVAQNILDALPFAVLGFDLEGTLVQCSQAGLEIFLKDGRYPLGRKRRKLLSPEINEIMDSLTELSCISTPVQFDGKNYRAWVTHLKNSSQEGIILVLQVDETRGGVSSPVSS